MYLHARKLALPKTIKALKIVLCLIHILSLDVCSTKERNICCSTFTIDKDRLRNII